METILLFLLAGFAAQFLGGALGMGYGITCTSILLMAGLAPVEASTAVHVTEAVTCFVAGLSHWRLGNVDWRLTLRLAVPGCCGAVIGALVLTNLSTKAAKPFMGLVLVGLGVLVLTRCVRGRITTSVAASRIPRLRMLAPLGLGAGFADATGGGGWGAITTSTLLGSGTVVPRVVVGSADASKCIVSIAATIALLSGGGHGVHGGVVVPLIAGGIVAAPLGALVATKLRADLFGVLAGVVIVAINLPTAVSLFPNSDSGLIDIAALTVALTLAIWALRRSVFSRV